MTAVLHRVEPQNGLPCEAAHRLTDRSQASKGNSCFSCIPATTLAEGLKSTDMRASQSKTRSRMNAFLL
jgi:hypothetical protein